MQMNELIVAAGVGAVAIMQGLILAKLSRFEATVDKTNALDTWAFGVKGDNGKNLEIKTIRDDVDELMDRRHGPADRRLA